MLTPELEGSSGWRDVRSQQPAPFEFAEFKTGRERYLQQNQQAVAAKEREGYRRPHWNQCV
jgi:hypothetical protein